jgi:large subunit ribosomal protein L22
MEVKAKLNGLRISPRKVRLVTGILKGMDANHAKNQLDYLAKRGAKPISKLLNSALANAHNNFGLVKENLYIKRIIVDEGTKLKRGEPKGFGSVSPIEKKSSHITIVLDERVPGMKAEKKGEHKHEEKIATQPSHKASAGDEKKQIFKETKESQPKPKAGGLRNLGKRFFRRKAI